MHFFKDMLLTCLWIRRCLLPEKKGNRNKSLVYMSRKSMHIYEILTVTGMACYTLTPTGGGGEWGVGWGYNQMCVVYLLVLGTDN